MTAAPRPTGWLVLDLTRAGTQTPRGSYPPEYPAGTNTARRPRKGVILRGRRAAFLTLAILSAALLIAYAYAYGQHRVDTWCDHQPNRAQLSTCDDRP